MVDVRWMWVLIDTVEADADVAAEFWRTVTRTEPAARQGERGQFVTPQPRRGDAWVALQEVIEGGGAHVDLAVHEPLPEAAAKVAALGATEVSRDDELVVLRSPGGLAFCLLSWTDTGSPANQVREGEPDLLDQVCIDIPSESFERECAFWQALTGWNRRSVGREFDRLERPDGIPLGLLLQRLDTAHGPVTAHVDFACHDRAASRRAHEAAGATFAAEPHPDEWTVMRDPAGRPYCLTSRTP